MARGGGGVRVGAGRKSSWASGCNFEGTKMIRVPKVLSDRLLFIAHYLDSGNSIELDAKSNNDNQALIEKAKQILNDESFIRSKDKYKHRKAFARLLGVDENFLK